MVFPLVWTTNVLYIKVMVVFALHVLCHKENSKCYFKSTEENLRMVVCDMMMCMNMPLNGRHTKLTSIRKEVLHFMTTQICHFHFQLKHFLVGLVAVIRPEPQKEPFVSVKVTTDSKAGIGTSLLTRMQ